MSEDDFDEWVSASLGPGHDAVPPRPEPLDDSEDWRGRLSWEFRHLLVNGTGIPEGNVKSYREYYEGEGGGRTGWHRDQPKVWSFICHARSQGIPRAVVKSWLMDAANGLGRFVRDVPSEFDEMWERAHPANPTHATATHRVVMAMAAAQAADPAVRLNGSDLRQMSGSRESNPARVDLMKEVVDGLVAVGAVEVTRVHARLIYYRLTRPPEWTLAAVRVYRFQQTPTYQKDVHLLMGVQATQVGMPSNREERQAAYDRRAAAIQAQREELQQDQRERAVATDSRELPDPLTDKGPPSPEELAGAEQRHQEFLALLEPPGWPDPGRSPGEGSNDEKSARQMTFAEMVAEAEATTDRSPSRAAATLPELRRADQPERPGCPGQTAGLATRAEEVWAQLASAQRPGSPDAALVRSGPG